MDATQMISDSILESDEDGNEDEREDERGRPLAKLCILKNEHMPQTELPLFLGDNVLGRDPNTCTLVLPAPSISKQHATICISVYRRKGCDSEVDVEALVWDQGSMNGTRKGRLKLTPNVRYALSESDSLVVADIPCLYVSVSSQGDSKTPGSKNSGLKSRLLDASGEKASDTSTGSEKCVNGGTTARVSAPVLEDTRKTPVHPSCLSFEQTPTHPQGTLVPESDSDSDGEKGGGKDRRRKAQVSDSDSHKSTPSCSTFLSPTNKIVPESEDESPITPSCPTENRLHRHVSFSKEETDEDVGRQQLKEKKALAIVCDGKEGEGRGEERAAPAGRKSEESGQHVPVKQGSDVNLGGEGISPVSTPTDFTGAIPAFNMDSDTDMEGEEDGVAAVGPVTLNTNQEAGQPPGTAQFHLDSDTDVDEDDDSIVAKSVPPSADNTKPSCVTSLIQPEGITMDSDTDVDDDAAVSEAATKAKPTSFQNTHTADIAPSTQPKDFHLDSDTDADEEGDKECVTNNTCSKIDESAPAAPHSLHLDSDTDDEAIPAPAISEPVMVSAVTESLTTADRGADLDILSDSDTDVDDNSPLVIPVVATDVSVAPDTMSKALQSGSDADTDVDESSVPPAGNGVGPAKFSVDSDTDVEEKEVDFGEEGEGQIPGLQRENTPGFLVPLLQNCSTPVQLSEGDVQDMETQAFLSPSSVPLKSAVASAVRPKALPSCSDSQEDEDFVVAETQSFVLQKRDNSLEDHTTDPTQAFGLESSGDEKSEESNRGGSFQLGLSDSSHLQCQAQAQAMESTQAFVSVEGGVNLEETKAYSAISKADRTSLEDHSNLEATQAYGEEEEEHATCSAMPEREGQVDLALEATQAYVSELYNNSEDETDEEERKNSAIQPLEFPTSSTLTIAETQPMSAFNYQESLDGEDPVYSALQVERKPKNVKHGQGEHGEAAQFTEKGCSEALSVAETQPMCRSDSEESDDDDVVPGPRKRKTKPLALKEEQTQPLTCSGISLTDTQLVHIGVDETQPLATSGNEESDSEDSKLGPRKHKAKQLRLEEEETQTLRNSELSGVETQPMDTVGHGDSDEEDSIIGPRKRKARQLQLEDEQTQSLTSSEPSAVETQSTGVDGESDEEDSIPGPRKRKAKPLLIQEEETQSLSNSEASAVETLSLETKAGLQPQSGEGRQSEDETSSIPSRGKRGTRSRVREEEEQAECSQPPRRQTRGSSKALPATRGRRPKSGHDEDESEEEEKVEHAKQARGKKSTKQKHNEEERKEKEDQQRLQAENAERLRLEQERTEKRRIQQERKEQDEKERADRAQREKDEQLERERKEKEEKERLECEKAEREEKERIEKERQKRDEAEKLETAKREQEERLERERKEQEEKERADRTRKEKEEQLERERKEEEEKKRLEREKGEREDRERVEKERKDREEIERLETAKREEEERLERERKEQEHQARLAREAKEKEEKEKLEKDKQEKEKPKAAVRGRRETRTTNVAPSTTQPEQDSEISTNDDVPARRTRSRSNSSNSVSSERSASSVITQQSSGRGRGRGAKRTSEPPQAPGGRKSNRRRTVAAGATEQDSKDISPQGVRSRSNSTNSHSSEISSCSFSSQSRGRGGRQRGRGRRAETETDSVPAVNDESEQNPAPKPTARGRKSRKAEESSNEVSHEGDKETADSLQVSTTRRRRRADAKGSEPAAADEEELSNQEEARTSKEFLLPKKNGRGQKAERETVEASVAPAVIDGDEAKEKRKGRKRELEANTEEDSSSFPNISKKKERAQTTETVGEDDAKGETKDETSGQAKRRGRTSSAQAKKNAKPKPTEIEDEGEKMEEETVERRVRGRPSAVQKKKKEEREESGASADQDASVEASEPRTPTSSVSRKRQAPADFSPMAKTPRSSSASPAASGRSRIVSQGYKVLYTGVVDEEGERVLARLGGCIADDVTDMNCLVTDKVRRTVKFLCAVAKGVPIVTTQWLEKSGKAGSFLSPNGFVVKDPEQERKFNFCLQESLRIASSQPLLHGYAIHVTKSVKPEPAQMKDIISCSGATFLPKMPSSHKPQTVVISCEEDWPLCGPALTASLPIVTAEFILTGILQQKVDLQAHALSAPTRNLPPAGGRGRGRKRT